MTIRKNMRKKKSSKKRLLPASSAGSRQDDRLLMDFMDNIPDVVYVKDRGGRLVFVNAAHARGLGLTPREVVGKTDFDIFPRKKAQRMHRDDQWVMKTGKPIIDKIERGTRPDGVDNYVSTTKIPRRDANGKIIGLIGVTRDVTKRVRLENLRGQRVQMAKKLETLEELNQLKSEFVSTVSHELRTPLAIVQQLLTLVFDENAGALNDQQREILVRMRHQMERLKNTINQLLDISRMERRKFKLHYSFVNLNELFRDSAGFFQEMARERNIRLSYVFPKQDVHLFIDAERIVQVIINLVNNALKFTEENGSIAVEVKMFETKVRVGVIDTGIGILKEDLPKLFDKFMQVSRNENLERKGLGLGLSIAKEIIELHGGEIWVESKPGVGSKFYFTLPRYYTAGMLEKTVKERINRLLKGDAPVYLINLLVVNYEEFKKRIKVAPPRLSQDLKEMIDATFKNYFGTRKNQQIFVSDMNKGKHNIIFSEKNEKKVADFCETLKAKTKEYFTSRKIEDVFIAIGILSYPTEKAGSSGRITNLNIKEIYIGSEMRRFKRINYKTKMEVIAPEEARQTCETVDLSESGLCFISQKLLKTDQQIVVLMDLLRKKRTVCAKTRVAWIKKMDRMPDAAKEQYKIGLEFMEVAAQHKILLGQELKLYYE